MVLKGKGWHNESVPHSEARLYGRASGRTKGLKAPTPKNCVSQGNTVFYKLPNGKYVRAGSSWKVGAYKNVMKRFDALDKKQLEKESKEHPTLPKETVAQIVADHKESPAQIEKDYNAVSKPEYQTHKYAKEEFSAQQGVIKPDHTITPSDYSGFTGTVNYYSDYMGIKLTDGVKDLQTRAEANWLTSDIAVIVKSHPKVRTQDFVTIKLNVKEDTATATYEDGNGNKLYKQNYKYTDFPKGNWKFFFRDNTLMFPSEY